MIIINVFPDWLSTAYNHMPLYFWGQHDFPIELMQVRTCFVDAIGRSVLLFLLQFFLVKFFFFSLLPLTSGCICWMHRIIRQEN